VVAHLTEEEQIEALKNWWKKNGNSTLMMVVVVLGLFFAWNQYKSQQATKAANASSVFQQLIEITPPAKEGLNEENEKKINQITGEIKSNSNGTLYSDFADLTLAKVAVDKGEQDQAIKLIEGVIASSKDQSIKQLARTRLARLLANKGEFDSALATLSESPTKTYVAVYEEIKGDIYATKKELASAQAAYQKALDSMELSQMSRMRLLQMKLDNVKVSSVASHATPQDAKEANPHQEEQAGDA